MANSSSVRQPSSDEALRWRFGEILFDETTFDLSVGGEPRELTRKPLDLLMFFLRNPGEVVTKDELFEAVWPGRIVSETSLTNAIGRLRSALNDDDQKLIKTVYGYGYRFTGEPQREAVRPIRIEIATTLEFSDGDPVPLREGWVLRRRLGAGGGGEAWLARHDETNEARVFKFARDRLALVALKREITLSRLMRESLGERPHFVRVLDWNLDIEPFFVALEHCNEGSLVDWAQQQGGINRVPLAQRLELLAQAADALAGAHQVGVLHKDLKPSNLLLHKDRDGHLVLKLADFGSARLIDRDRLHALDITRLGFTQTLADNSSGTPLYLAPELLAGSPSTTRSDVYALGVMLYQLAVGDLRRTLAPGWEREIDDPVLVEDIAEAAAGDPQRRLSDATQLAIRLRTRDQRHQTRLQQQAVSRSEEVIRQALARARARRSLWMALALVSVAGLALTFWQFLGARNAEKRATAASAESESVAAFLIDDVLATADPLKQSESELTVKAMLDAAGSSLYERLGEQLRVRARIALGLATALNHAGDIPGSIRLNEAAIKDAENAGGLDDPLTLKAKNQLADALMGTSQFERAEQLFSEVVAHSGKLAANDPLVLDAYENHAYLAYTRGQYLEAAQLYEAYRQHLPASEDDPQVITYNDDVPDVYNELGRFSEAEALSRKALAAEVRLSGANSGAVNLKRLTLADTLMRQQRWDEAEREILTAEEGLAATMGPEHAFTVSCMALRGRLRLLRGDPAGALPLVERAYTIRLRLYGPKRLGYLSSANAFGRTLTALGRATEAVPLLETALVNIEALQSPQHPRSLETRANLAEALVAAGNRPRAHQLMIEALPRAKQILVPDGERITRFRQVLAQTEPP